MLFRSTGNCNAMRPGPADQATKEAGDDRCDQRAQNNGQVDGLHSLAFQHVKILDVDRSLGAEQHNQDGEADGRFGSSNRQNEKYKYLPVRVAEEAGEGNKVKVRRQQHQFDTHQQQDDILPIQENAGDADHKQDSRQRQIAGQ